MVTYDVITACRNSGRTIARTLSSVLQQRPLPTRYIIVDRASTDEMLDLINQSKREYPQIEWIIIHQENEGIADARNLGLPHASSEVVSILNSDDWWEDKIIEGVLQHFQSNEHIGAVAGGYSCLARRKPCEAHKISQFILCIQLIYLLKVIQNIFLGQG